MSCITPMFYCYPIGNKKGGKIVPRSEVMQGLEMDPNNIRNQLNIMNANARKTGKGSIYVQVPCRKCWACQLKYSAEWATRIMLEAKKYEHNYFITLTYDDDHLPVAEAVVNPDTGEMYKPNETWKEGTLAPEDFGKFIKDLRNELQNNKKHQGFKYFYCGEYGGSTHRPHGHFILMNCPLDINQFYDTHVDWQFKAHWKSHELDAKWGKGFIDVAELEWSSAAYVARYCTKKISFDTDKSEYYKQGKYPEYVRMSKGIGKDFFLEHKDEIYKTDEIVMKTVKGNLGSVKPPKYFDRMFEKHDPEGFKMIKRSRELAAERSRLYLEKLNDQTDLQRLKLNAENIATKAKNLPRDMQEPKPFKKTMLIPNISAQ